MKIILLFIGLALADEKLICKKGEHAILVQSDDGCISYCIGDKALACTYNQVRALDPSGKLYCKTQRPNEESCKNQKKHKIEMH